MHDRYFTFMNKLILSIFLSGLLCLSSRAQIDIDLGITAGSSFYLGDINPDKLFHNSNFSYGCFVRFNAPDARYSVRLNGLLATLQAADADSKNQYQKNRNASFETNIGEISAYVEFNFLPFRVPSTSARHKKFSPFLLSGLTYSTSSLSKSSLVLPLGVGFKFVIWDKLIAHIEWIMKKTFTDQLDNLSDPINTGSTSIFFNTDWYSYTGLSLSFELFEGNQSCRNYENYKKREDYKRKQKNK